jgi:peroxiredoxin
MRTVLIASIALMIAGNGASGAEQVDPKKLEFKNEPGWIWHVGPMGFGGDVMSTGGLVFRLDDLKSDQLLMTLAYLEQSAPHVAGFRPVVFNASGERFDFTHSGGGASDGVVLNGFVLDLKKLPRDQIKFFGIEKLTEDGLRDVLAPAAFRKLKESGVNALPFPRLGERYEFELTTIDGKKISSKDLEGKVVLLDFWATWCSPCMAKMTKMKEIYQEIHGRGFEIVGVSHDYTVERAQRTITEQKLPWPNVVAPVDDEQQKLWCQATGVSSLPRLLLIDRAGILRADVSPDDLPTEIKTLMSKP